MVIVVNEGANNLLETKFAPHIHMERVSLVLCVADSRTRPKGRGHSSHHAQLVFPLSVRLPNPISIALGNHLRNYFQNPCTKLLPTPFLLCLCSTCTTMTGFEVVGLVLAIFPLVIEGLKFYAEEKGLVKDFLRYRHVLKRLIQDLSREQTSFHNSCHRFMEDIAAQCGLGEDEIAMG